MAKPHSIETESTSVRYGGFWCVAGALLLLYGVLMARDINRPFYGLHAWAEAAAAWRGRALLHYPLSYTKGLAVWSVGDPPQENPNPSLDHPQPGMMTWAVEQTICGQGEWSLRAWKILRALISLALLLRLLRLQIGDKGALLAGLIFALLPISGYFGTGSWHFPLAMVALWCYLVLIRQLPGGPEPGRLHWWGLGAAIMLGIQINWEGVFFPFAIGIHYVCRCLARREWPQGKLFAVITIAPLVSLASVFAVMLAGHGWDVGKIVDLYLWRGTGGDAKPFTAGTWLAKFGEFAVLNFTWPVLIATVAYLTLHLASWPSRLAGAKKKDPDPADSLTMPHLWLWLIPGIAQLLIFRGAMWYHHYWQRPFQPIIAIAAALAILRLARIVNDVRRPAGTVAAWAVIGVIAIAGVINLNHYYAIRTFSPQRVKMFKFLHTRIAKDERLLAAHDEITNQHPVKGPHYRPEVAWYLDRQIVKATSVGEIRRYAATGKYPYYLMPLGHPQFEAFAREVQKEGYKVVATFPGDPGGEDLAPMRPYLLFDLRFKSAER